VFDFPEMGLSNKQMVVVVILILVVLAGLRLAGTYQIPVADQIDRFTLGSVQGG
jgi:hypothetical protein